MARERELRRLFQVDFIQRLLPGVVESANASRAGTCGSFGGSFHHLLCSFHLYRRCFGREVM